MLLTDRCRAACSLPLQALAHQSSWPHSLPPCSSPAGHFKRLLGASQIPIKGPGRSAHPRKRASQGDMIKSTLLGKEGRQGRALAGTERKGRQDIRPKRFFTFFTYSHPPHSSPSCKFLRRSEQKDDRT